MVLDNSYMMGLTLYYIEDYHGETLCGREYVDKERSDYNRDYRVMNITNGELPLNFMEVK